MIPASENADSDLLTAVQRHQPASIQDLCDELQVTATAVRQRLLRLQAVGYLVCERQHQDRGRPCNVYSLTEKGMHLLGDDHVEIAGVMWREILKISHPDVRRQVLDGVQQALVRRFGTVPREGSLEGRVRAVCERLGEHGFDVDVEVSESDEENSLPILREHNCPYHGLVAEDASFCEMEQAVFSELVGAPVELAVCRRDGHHCCEFQIGTPETAMGSQIAD